MRKIWVNKAYSFKEAERFNMKFWQKQSANVKWQALWIMVGEFYKLRGKNAAKLRLQRHIENIQQI